MWNKKKVLILLFISVISLTFLFLFSTRNAFAEEVQCNVIPWSNGDKMYNCPASLRTCSAGIVGCAGTLCNEDSGGVAHTSCLPSPEWGSYCWTICGPGSGGSVGPPDDDIGWVRIFSRSFNSTEVYYGPSDVSGLSVNSTNRKDWTVNVSTNSGNEGGEIWSGHMCGRGKAASIAPDGKLNTPDNSACIRSGNECAPDDGDGCNQVEVFRTGPGLADINADNDKTSHVNKLHHILKDGFNRRLDNDGDWIPETIPYGMPMQRYDKIYTFNFKAVENKEWKVRVTTPMSYFCYNAYGLLRYDDGQVRLGDKDSGGGLFLESAGAERLHQRPELEDPSLGVLDDGTRCSVELAFKGGGNYVLFEVRKSVIGKVVSLSGTANSAAGLPGVQVSLRYNNNNTTPVTVTTTTDSNGYYRFNEPNLYTSQFYTVFVSGSIPSGHTGAAFAVDPKNYLATTGSNIGYTFRSDSRDTRVGDPQFFGQSTITNNDCSSSNVEANLSSGRCFFGFNRTPAQFPNGTLSVVNNSNKVPSGLSYDHAVCLNGSVSYATSVIAYPLLRAAAPYSLSTSVTGATSGYGTWVNQFQTFTGTPGSTMSSTDSNAYTTARGYTAGSNYYVALTVSDSVGRMCSGNPYVNYSTYSPSTTKYCGVYSPNMVNPMTDTNATKPYKTIHIPYTPIAPTVVATTTQRDQITLTWSYPSNPGVAYLSDVQRYRIYRGSTLIADVPATTNPATFRYVDTGATCGTNVTYTVRAETGYRDIAGTLRSCGVSAASGPATAVGSCVPNLPPVCNIQYRNSAGTWVAYSNSLLWPKNTSIPVRLVCTDPNNDPILRYAWSTSCGTISPTNVQTTSYLTLNQNGVACNLTGRGYDKITDPPSSDTHTVIIRTENPTPGTQVLSTAALGATCLSKSSPSTTAVSFNVTNYDDDSDGVATINNTLVNSVCGLNGTTRIGTCSFTVNSALSVNFPPFRVGTTTEPIRITLRTGSTPGSYGINKGSLAMPIRVSWDPYTGTTRNIDNTICVTDLPPTLASGVVSKGPGNNNFNISANASDDWSLKSLRIDILNTSSVVVSTPYNNATHFTERTVAQMTNANHTDTVNYSWSVPSTFSVDGSYRARITVSDNSGRPANIGVFTTAPFVIDRAAPSCQLISFSPANTNHDGALNVAISSTASDLLSSITKYRIYVKDISNTEVADSGTISVTGNLPNVPVPRSYNWSTPLNLPRGTYTAYVDWTDSNDNATNTADSNRCLAAYEIENPPIQIMPSLVTVVEDSSECASSGIPFAGVNVRLNNDPNSQNTKTDASGLYSFTSANLEYGRSYSIELTGINDAPLKGYSACSGSNIRTDFKTPDTFDGVDNHLITMSPIKLYKQEATKWWQAYNGGVHSNIEKVFPLNGAGDAEGMPEDAVIIGDPTGDTTPPQGINMYGLLGVDTSVIPSFNGGGLYSSFGTVPPTPPFYGNAPRDWGVPNLTEGTNSKMRFAKSIDAMFDDVKTLIASGSSDWKEKPNFTAAINSIDMSYVSVDENTNIGGSVSSSGKTRVVLVEVDNAKTVNIDDDIKTSAASKPIILYVKGNILVKKNVEELNSVFLIATGTIEFESAGNDIDQPININGAIYASDILFQRDLEDSLSGIDEPAERIFYNSSLILNSNSIPAEITESKVYYVLTE